jgi:hypothetical protein
LQSCRSYSKIPADGPEKRSLSQKAVQSLLGMGQCALTFCLFFTAKL